MVSGKVSVFSRPIRPQSAMAGESAEKEYEKEQAKLQAKRNRYNKHQEFIRTCIDPTEDERHALRAEMNDTRSLQIAERRRQLATPPWLGSPEANSNIPGPQSVYPGSIPLRGTEDYREYKRQLLEENKRLAAIKRHSESQENEREREQARQDARYWDSSQQFWR